MDKYPTGILKNTKTEHFHPIPFRPAPLSSGKDADLRAQCYRSNGHHTEGFTTLKETQEHISENDDMFDVCILWDWDEESIPAMIKWFEKRTSYVKHG